MKEKKGPVGRAVGAVAQGIAGAARRRAEQRQPRVLVYGADGDGRLVEPGTLEHEQLVDTAARLIALGTGHGAHEPEPEPAEGAEPPERTQPLPEGDEPPTAR